MREILCSSAVSKLLEITNNRDLINRVQYSADLLISQLSLGLFPSQMIKEAKSSMLQNFNYQY